MARRLSPFEPMVAALDTIPGVGRRRAEVIAAEVGTDMKQVPTPGHLASWAGVCPGNKRSGPAGGPRGGGTGVAAPTGSHPQRQPLAETGPPFSRGQALVEAAQAGPDGPRPPGVKHGIPARTTGCGGKVAPSGTAGRTHSLGGAPPGKSGPPGHPPTRLNPLFSG